MSAALDLIQRQLEAYNARDLDALLATYAPDARQFDASGQLLASGHAALRARMAARFDDPRLHAQLLDRRQIGAYVVDHEIVTRSLPTGPGRVEMLAVYEVRDGLIRTATFAFAEPVLDALAAG